MGLLPCLFYAKLESKSRLPILEFWVPHCTKVEDTKIKDRIFEIPGFVNFCS